MLTLMKICVMFYCGCWRNKEMIPESIKIDDNGDFDVISKSWTGDVFLKLTFEEIEEAYLLAKSKRKHGCHVDADKGEIYDDCCIDLGYIDCSFASGLIDDGQCKTDCQYWRPFEVKK